MAFDLFGRQEAVFGGAYSADSAILSFAGITGVGLLTQSLNFGFNQSVSRIFEIGTIYQYYVVGRASGTFTLNRVLGPRPLAFTFYSIYGNACNAATNTIAFSMQQGCIDPNDPTGVATLATLSMLGCVIQSVGFSAQAEHMNVNENVSGMFVSLLPPAA